MGGLVPLILYAANTMLRCLQCQTVLYMLSALIASASVPWHLRSQETAPQPFHAGRAISRATTLPTREPNVVLDPNLQLSGVGQPLRPSISGGGGGYPARPPSPFERRSTGGALGGPMDAHTLAALQLQYQQQLQQQRYWNSSHAMLLRSPANPHGGAGPDGSAHTSTTRPEGPASPGCVRLKHALTERSISSPGLAESGRQRQVLVPAAAAASSGASGKPGSVGRNAQSPARGWLTMRHESSLGPALLASKVVGASALAAAVVVTAPGTPGSSSTAGTASVGCSLPGSPMIKLGSKDNGSGTKQLAAAAAATRPRRLSLPSVFQVVQYQGDPYASQPTSLPTPRGPEQYTGDPYANQPTSLPSPRGAELPLPVEAGGARGQGRW